MTPGICCGGDDDNSNTWILERKKVQAAIMGIMERRSKVSCQPCRKAFRMERTKVETRKQSIPIFSVPRIEDEAAR